MSDQPGNLSLLARFRVWLAPLRLQARDFALECIQDTPLLTRATSHVGLLALMVFAIAASNVRLNSVDTIDLSASAQGANTTHAVIQHNSGEDPGTFFFSPVPLTDIPKRVRLDVVQYTVQPGDTVSGIAAQFGISPDSVLWANPKLEDDPDMLSLGQVLNIPPVSGVLVTVQKGDTVESLANKYKGNQPVSAIVQNIVGLEFNQTRHDFHDTVLNLTTQEFLMIPGGSKPYVQRPVRIATGPIPRTAARGTSNFDWPLAGVITQGFWSHHPGIDIAAPTGTPIRAADSGYVVFAGWDHEPVSYGNMVLIDHGNGFYTRYAHMSVIHATAGESVVKGQVIGLVGATGNATGPHLHFEIILNGVHQNPFYYLPGGHTRLHCIWMCG